jgi:superfamily I DNA and/or RNA helicase
MVDPYNSKEARLVQSMADELPPGRGYTPALVFHGLRGRCIRDGDSPSWYNPNEVNQVFAYIKKLMAKDVKAWDIGVITFYAKQVNQQAPFTR